MNSIRTAVILAALVTTACSAGTVSPSAVPSSPPAATASPTAAPNVPAGDPLTGTWATGETTCAQGQAAVEAAGFTAEQMTSIGWGPDCPLQVTIRFADHRLVIFINGEVGWDGTYRIVDEDTFEAGDEPGAGYYITYHYVVDGDQLTIDMVENDCPICISEAELLGERLAQTEIYETSPFTRQD